MAIGLHNLVDTGVSADDNALSFPVFTIDKLFTNGLFAGESLAFLHLDIEGSELQALMGATKVIKRDRPVIVSETNITDKSYAPQLAILHQFGYRVLMVHELCGSLIGCRNLISVPDELWKEVGEEVLSHGGPSIVTLAPPEMRYNTKDASTDAKGFANFQQWNQHKLVCGTYQGPNPWKHGG